MVPIKFADGNHSCRQPRVREALVNDVTDIICVTVIMVARFALTDPGFGESSLLIGGKTYKVLVKSSLIKFISESKHTFYDLFYN